MNAKVIAVLRRILVLGILGMILLTGPSSAWARRRSSGGGHRGCCSHHGGVASCDGSVGSLRCNDGSLSPSCGCPKAEPEKSKSSTAATATPLCERGYHRVKGKCTKIQLPEHAVVDEHGNDWKCEAGYTRDGGKCVPAEDHAAK